MKIGMNVDAVKGISQTDYIKIMKEEGFEAAFSGTNDEEYHYTLAKNLSEYGIEYETIHAPFDGINAMWRDDGEQMYGRLCHAVDMCALSGAGIAIVHLSSGIDAPTLNDKGMARFASLVEYAAKKGVKIAFENQRKIANLSWALETFADAENVGFCWDCGHESCFTPGREYVPIFSKQLICTHIHDNTCVYNSDDHMIPFDGNMDFDKVADHLRKIEYKGTLMLEVSAKHTIYEKTTAQTFIQRAAEAAKRVRAKIENY